jgi:hypothetical protein
MAGEIGLESAESKGSTFWFTLPLRAASSLPASVHMSELGGRRVIVVDDNITNAEILERQVIFRGMRCTTAHRGAQALELLRNATAVGDPSSSRLWT